MTYDLLEEVLRISFLKSEYQKKLKSDVSFTTFIKLLLVLVTGRNCCKGTNRNNHCEINNTVGKVHLTLVRSSYYSNMLSKVFLIIGVN